MLRGFRASCLSPGSIAAGNLSLVNYFASEPTRPTDNDRIVYELG